MSFCWSTHAQAEPALAKNYYDKGEFEKALALYQSLVEAHPFHQDYIFKTVDIYQQLEQYEKSESLIENQFTKTKGAQFLVELGFNYQLQNQTDKAQKLYKKAISAAQNTPHLAYSVAQRFEVHSLIDQAVIVYETALKDNFNPTFQYQLAGLYGAQQNIEKMFTTYIDFIETNESFILQVKRLMADYINEDPEHPYNLLLKNVLLKKSQTQPNLLWNYMLSWLYVQQLQYAKAFVQEKAIFRRQPNSIQGLLDLVYITKEAKAFEVTTRVLNFIIENTQDPKWVVEAHLTLIELELQQNKTNDYSKIQSTYEHLLDTHGLGNVTLKLQLSYAHFLGFHIQNKINAVKFLKTAMTSTLDPISIASLKMKLADIELTQQHFNQALVYYTQIQTNVKNSPLAQEARFKVAKASFYKGDFDWALSQLKVLKSSSSQLIANDALELHLLISDHTVGDSLHLPLKRYAKAEFLNFQNQPEHAIEILNTIIKDYKTEPIIDETLLFQAQLFESLANYDEAATNYKQIIDNFRDSILIDDAYFALAELLRLHLSEPENAKTYYEYIIFNNEDSIHYVEARKHYRALRGDVLN